MIKYKGNRLTSEVYNQLHADSIHFINQELQLENQGKTVMVPHHVPTFMNYPKLYKGSKINEGFAVELFDTIEASSVDYWIYGQVTKMLDGFEGKLTTTKWAKITKCSPDTALRDIQDLISKGILLKEDKGGRSTSYSVNI